MNKHLVIGGVIGILLGFIIGYSMGIEYALSMCADQAYRFLHISGYDIDKGLISAFLQRYTGAVF